MFRLMFSLWWFLLATANFIIKKFDDPVEHSKVTNLMDFRKPKGHRLKRSRKVIKVVLVGDRVCNSLNFAKFRGLSSKMGHKRNTYERSERYAMINCAIN